MKKSTILAICTITLALVGCSDEPDKRPVGYFRTVVNAEELIVAMNEGVDIYVPEDQVINMNGKPAPSVNKDIEVCVDGVVTGLSGYVYVNDHLTLTGKGRIECTGKGGLYVNQGGTLDASFVTIDFTAPQFQVYGCAIYVNGGRVDLDQVTVTSTNQCVFSSQLILGSRLTANSCKFLSTATQYNCCYAIEAPGQIYAIYKDCQISSFYGGVITESPKATVELHGTHCAVYMPTNTSYTCEYAATADAGGTIKLSDDTALYGEGKYVAVQNNRYGDKGTLLIYDAHVYDKPFDIPATKTVDPAEGYVWTPSNEDYTFYYPDGSTRKYKQQWYSAPA